MLSHVTRHETSTLPKWNAATDDIDTVDLFTVAQDYEKSFLPSGISFPRTGQIWEAMRDCEVGFVASFRPGSPFELRYVAGQRLLNSTALIPVGRARLSRGERVRVVFADDPKPLAIWFQPLRCRELHESIVPAEVRNMPGYSHYRLTLQTIHTACFLAVESEYFTEAFRQVEDMV